MSWFHILFLTVLFLILDINTLSTICNIIVITLYEILAHLFPRIQHFSAKQNSHSDNGHNGKVCIGLWNKMWWRWQYYTERMVVTRHSYNKRRKGKYQQLWEHKNEEYIKMAKLQEYEDSIPCWNRDAKHHINKSVPLAAEHTLLMLQDTALLSLCTGQWFLNSPSGKDLPLWKQMRKIWIYILIIWLIMLQRSIPRRI
jgi:hypothetical protein